MIKGKLAYLNRLYSRVPMKSIALSDHIEGASPPSVFIGRYGYPKVYVGPLVPQAHGDTRIMDLPEKWLSYNDATNIINFRVQLVRGKQLVGIKDDNRMTDMLKEIALAKRSVELEADFSKVPRGAFLHEEVQPFGPSGPLKQLSVASAKMEQHMEKAHQDTDLLSKEAVIGLYEKGLPMTTIQKAFSTGAFGRAKNRKLVPTRWSITAVDDMLGMHLLERVKQHDPIEEYRIYETEAMQNKFIILFLPGQWRYESMECFFPQVIGDKLEIYSDWEGYEKKKNYALIGGCYYSARFAITELLNREKSQAGAIVLRECYPGYIPLGVWNVRENMREALKKPYVEMETLNDALRYVSTNMRIKADMWIRKSHLFRRVVMEQRAKPLQA